MKKNNTVSYNNIMLLPWQKKPKSGLVVVPASVEQWITLLQEARETQGKGSLQSEVNADQIDGLIEQLREERDVQAAMNMILETGLMSGLFGLEQNTREDKPKRSLGFAVGRGKEQK